nr:CPBP family intramembrane metalloprotease [Candidatus Sigynarchaeota archaeon]
MQGKSSTKADVQDKPAAAGSNSPKLFLLLMSCGLLIQPFPIIYLPEELKIFYAISITLVFLLVAIHVRGKESLKKYFPVMFAFFTSALVLTLQFYTRGGGIGSTPWEKVLWMVASASLVVVPIILLTKKTGSNMASIFLQKGDLKKGLIIGLVTFTAFLVTSVPAAIYIFGGRADRITPENLIAWSPWIVAFVFLNSLREELWFRGIFLKKFEKFFKADIANLLQAIPFSIAHLGIRFDFTTIIYLVLFFFLGLGFGAIMQKTNSILGAVLFHAGADIPVMIMTFSLL